MGRRRQWGSVRRLASGRYQARLPDGSPAPDTFPTKAEASRWLALAEADLVRGTFVHPSLNANVTVAEWLAEWRASHSLHKRPTTLVRDESAIRRHLLPRLGDIQLANLRQTDVQAFVADLRREVGPGTTRSIYGVLRAALNAAVNAAGGPLPRPRHQAAPNTQDRRGHRAPRRAPPTGGGPAGPLATHGVRRRCLRAALLRGRRPARGPSRPGTPPTTGCRNRPPGGR
jgi:Phage integrase, N-terminal SAM-like domain